MATGENEIRVAMVESGRRLPGLLAVTGLALIAELAAMLVEVAGVAARREPEKRLAPGLSGKEVGDLFIDDQTRLVTLIAIHLRVLTKKWKADLLVGEAFLGRDPLDQVEVSSLVLVMAALATSVRLRDTAVKAGALGELGLQLRVTGNAFIRRNLLGPRVALGAVGHSLQLRVRFGKLAG